MRRSKVEPVVHVLDDGREFVAMSDAHGYPERKAWLRQMGFVLRQELHLQGWFRSPTRGDGAGLKSL
jgi:hypothetical protein